MKYEKNYNSRTKKLNKILHNEFERFGFIRQHNSEQLIDILTESIYQSLKNDRKLLNEVRYGYTCYIPDILFECEPKKGEERRKKMNVKKLKLLMVENEEKPKDVADLLGISKGRFYARLNGNTPFKFEEIRKLADHYKVDINIFLE